MKLAAGEYLYREGDTSEAMYVIRSGEIGLYVTRKDGVTELMRLGPGQLVGDLAFFTGAPRTAAAKAICTSECLEVQYTKVRSQFELVPPWLKMMTKTLADQVMSYSHEVRALKAPEDPIPLSRLAVARAWAALALVPNQFGQRDGKSVSIDWPLLRTYANLSFREISASVMQLTNILSTLESAEIRMERDEPAQIVFKDVDLIVDFLRYYIRGLSKDSPELRHIDPTEFHTLEALARTAQGMKEGYKGLVTVDLADFKRVAGQMGHHHLSATSVDLLKPYGIEIEKIVTETSVQVRFQLREVVNLAQFWRILLAIQKLNYKKD